MSNNKNSSKLEEPMLFEEEEKYYETEHGKKILSRGKNRIIATNRRLLVFTGSGYKSLFYDKIAVVNVKNGKQLEISLVGGKEPEVFTVSRKGALGLFEVVSRMISLSSDARMAYAIGTLEAQKNIMAKQQAVAMEVGARHVMEYISEETNEEKATTAKQRMDAYADDYSKKHMVSVNAKNSEGKQLNISFNFIPKIKNSIYSAMSSEALYTLTHSVYSKSSAVAGMLYGNTKSVGSSLSATIASTMKQSAKEEVAKSAYAMKYVALSNISHTVVLEGDTEAYASPNCFCFPDLSIEEFAGSIYQEFGERLVGTHVEAIADKEGHSTETLSTGNAGLVLLRKEHAERDSFIEATNAGHETNSTVDLRKQEVAKRILENSIIFNARALNEKKKNEKKIFEHFTSSKKTD
ncbi:hypothetical protein M1567_02040 [Candidatus Marsarchaeota archaeon]|jgi:hypothetical protein|nr:hypothetical protein [Candidatus Marsarchaeota archaeon]